MPVAGDRLVPFRGFRAALGDIIRPAHGEVAGEQEPVLVIMEQAR
jgi:hypothetical protein